MPKRPIENKNETEWQKAWKAPIADQFCNIDEGLYNVDIKTDKYVIKIQRDFISKDEAQKLMDYYHELGLQTVWVLNIENAWKEKDIITTKYKKEFGNGKFKLGWKDNWKWVYDIIRISNHVYLDFNSTHAKIFKAWTISGVMYAKWFYRLEFYRQYLKSQIQPNYEIKYILRDYFMSLEQ